MVSTLRASSPQPNRFGRRARLPWGVALVVLLIVVARLWQSNRQPLPPPESLDEDVHQVERVVDGDTLLLTDRARVRLMGVDTPEVFERGGTGQRKGEPDRWGPEASAFTKKFVGDGQVRLQFDKERKDQYGRFLAYVWVGDRMLNEELLREGLARHTPQYRFSESMKKRFRKAEEDARIHRRGLWSGE